MLKPFALALLRAALVAVCCISSRAGASEGDSAAAMQLLKSRCFSCHNEEKAKGGLVMTSLESLMKGGESGAAVVAGEPEKSAIITSLDADADPHMPPKKQLSAEEIATLSAWVKAGAAWNADALIPKAREVALAPLPGDYQPVLALALSPDGKRLAAARGNQLTVFEAGEKSLTLVANASAHPDAIQSIAWSPDGARLATGAFRRVVIWNAAELSAERVVREELADRITALHFTADGKQLVVADGRIAEEGTIHFVDAQTGARAATWAAHRDTIASLALSPDGKLLASAGADKFVKLWEVSSQKETARIEAHTTQVLAAGFSPDGTQLVTGGADQQLKGWEVKTRDQVMLLGRHSAPITGAVWLANGPAIVAITESGEIARYTDFKAHTGAQSSDSAKERKFEAAPAGSTLYCLTAHSESQRVFAGTHDGRILGWNKDGKLIINHALEGTTPGSEDAAPTFTRDVLPILSKAGCNGGSCHAKPEGQNGFRLSVFSYDPKADYHEITREARERRIFPAAPEESLLLLKATNAIPHEGGDRFAKDSDSYRALAAWMRAGMPFTGAKEPALTKIEVTPKARSYRNGETQSLQVQAHYADGSTRDVTALADFESNDKEVATVTPEGSVTAGNVAGQAVVVARFMGQVGDSQITVPAEKLLPAEKYAALPVKNFIDRLAYDRFQQLGLFPSDGCTDTEFLRRASLDTLGLLPTADEARAFLDDTDPDKRAKLVERLLEHPGFADYWANRWADLLRPNPDRVGVKSVYVLDQWLRESFRRNKPYDQFVREIVLAEGNNHRDGPAVIYRDRREPADLTTTFSQLFLGVRLDCAKCHHHPNEKWGQDDFYRMAAFFGPLKQKGGGISAPISGGSETFYFAPGKAVKHPVTGEVMEPRPPDGPAMKLDEKSDPRQALAEWMLGAENPFFAKAIANRVWAAFFGKGIVDPVDDFRLSNPPSHPALLDELAQEVIRQKYDLKALMRTILTSHLYQLSGTPNEWNRGDTRNFSRSYRRRLPAEVIADAIADVTGVPNSYQGMPPGSRAIEAWTYKIDSRTMDAFGRPNSSSDCPCERDAKPSITQSLHLMNSRSLHGKLKSTEAGARVEQLSKGDRPPEEIVTALYLACFSRPPSEEEMKIAIGAFSAEGATKRTATEDLLWALLNSAEFVFNH